MAAMNMSGSPTAEESEAYAQGLVALKENRLELAVQLLGQGLQALVEKHGADALECADAYYRYGLALFHQAQEESDVFGSTLQTSVAQHDEGPSRASAAGPSGSRNAEGNGTASARDVEEEDEEGEDGEEDEEESADDDMQLAWENLEVARSIYEHHQDSHAVSLANVHMALADLATEQESFEDALSDYRQAQTLLQPRLKENDRQLAELHFKIGLALHFLNQPGQALPEIQKAKQICEAALKEPTESTAVGSADELQSILTELHAKEEELQEAVTEIEKTKDTLRAAFQSAMGTAPAASSGAPQAKVVDLGVVGQGKKRLNLAPIAPAPSAVANASGKEAATVRPKRRLEDSMGGAETSEGFGAGSLQTGKKQAGDGVADRLVVQTDASAAISTKPTPKIVSSETQQEAPPALQSAAEQQKKPPET